MADEKALAAAAAAKKKTHEFEELRQAAGTGAQLESVLGLVSPVKGLGVISALGEMSEIQLRHALISNKDVQAGEGKDFQKAFDNAYRYDRLPEVKTPTRSGVFVIEDSPKGTSEKTPFTHGHSVAAYGMAASKAMTGKEHPIQLISRLPMENQLGTTWVRNSKSSSGAEMRHLGPDLAKNALQKEVYDKNSVNVFSVSLVYINNDLKTVADRLASQQKLSEYFGKRAVFVVASGNEETQRNVGNKHNALRSHPHTLVVGAAHLTAMTGSGGEQFHGYGLTHYSAPGADIVMVATPPGARYSSTTEKGIRQLPQAGTSTAAPQAAALVAHLVRRFATSKENPEAVLSEQDVLLALKNTARPLPAAILDKVGYDIGVEPPTEHREGRQAFILQNYQVGDHLVSLEAGNGMADAKGAWALLEKQEKEVRAGKAKVLKRKDVAVTLTPKAHVSVKREEHYMLPLEGAATYFCYDIEVKDHLHADQVVLNLHSATMSEAILKKTSHERPRLFLVNPAGELAEVGPSTGFMVLFNSETKMLTEVPNDYLIGRAAGMQGSAMKGTWKVLCTEKLDKIEVNFDRAMQPEHVGVTVKPDRTMENTRFRHADFTAHEREYLEELLKPGAEMYDYDLSKTGFPPYFTDIKLAMLAQSDKKTAEKLLEVRYHAFKEKNDLAKAVAGGKPAEVMAVLIPEAKKFEAFKAMVATEPKENLVFLIKNGFANAKEVVAKGKNPSTALIELVKQRDMKIDPELVKAFIDAGADVHAQDEMGRTALHYARNAEVQKMLVEIDINGKPGTRMFEIKDRNGKTYLEISWTTGIATPIERFKVAVADIGEVHSGLNQMQGMRKALAV